MKSTSPFRFKQFTVHQDRAAMKVGFDGILLGAWANVFGCRRILDVGTGTGLIALMLAQRCPDAIIDAIDIDGKAAAEAEGNFRKSPWCDRLHAEHVSFAAYARCCETNYDLIVCNPPYFEGGQKSSGPSKSLARHVDALSTLDLIELSIPILADHGAVSLILPFGQRARCQSEVERNDCEILRELRVRSLPQKPYHRCLLEFGRQTSCLPIQQELTIEREHHVYTDEFRELARDFYLAF